MNITIIGATSGVGLSCVKKALAKGHKVTALSPRAQQLLQDEPMLTKINGSATSLADLKEAIKNADAILVCINTKKKKGTTLFSEMANVVIPAMEEICPDAVILVISGFGVGNSRPYLGFFMKLIINLLLKDQYDDKAVMESLFARSKLKWEMVRPGILSDASPTGKYQIFPSLFKKMKIGKITKDDLADFMIKEAGEKKFLLKTPAITQSI
ncbi:Putative NADH-flavin reductase [Mucilaginibacter lappiensis]|uniref:NADH-flavin reductase n=1 Tax=Mucilaginibacter lappiensis TaxID=354630 RepID=A0ABR6PJR9_9SPHI|nr:NAD(P)H-binding protein [Mucilaginibacter lappiensis]MBB6110018.1 putative NADH-flavin reductase [Mucilaginibacter lappiensis]SIR55280.1 Putative NADH-flavin reductase [Mucilaginibacter lappiensis]